ncbi:MAG: hydroxyisourate hydrolase [Bacteroidia bacterium]
MMNFSDFNQDLNATKDALFACCGSQNWVNKVMSSGLINSEKELVECCTDVWYNQCDKNDYLESFTHHPEIGDFESLKEKFAGKEQAGISVATENTINQLAQANKDYKAKFGFIFIVCATGKSADEMLQLLINRLENSLDEEIAIAMGEQMKISIIRLQKLFPESDWSFLKVSQLTSHILDTTIGKPAKDIRIQLQHFINNQWFTLTEGITNSDGRIADLLAPNRILPPSTYKLIFDTKSYFNSQNIKGFYPQVDIHFTISDSSHYHVPLLINPYGYSTYRGS